MSDLSVEIQRRLAISVVRAPAPVLRAVAGPPRRSPEGYVLDPQIQALLRLNDRMRLTSWSQLGVERGRRLMERSARILAARPAGALSVRDQVIAVDGGSIALRFYMPSARGRPLPILVYYHGGGFVLGSLDSHDGECRALALGAGAIVVSVDYRLAPEHRFPTAVDDGLAALRWIAGNAASFGGDPARIAVGGDSAGGNIAAVVARDARGDSAKIAFQLLIYPAVDFTRSHPSHRHFREGFMLTEESIDWFTDHYLGKRDRTHHRASPLFADDHAGVPPAMILTAGFDPLRDEAKAYADKLSAAGVAVDYRCYEGLVHGFFNMSAAVDVARRALDDAVSALRRALHPGP
jgi:acetyl esterase